MIKFTEIKWLKWWYRGRPFGSHMRASAYLPSGTVINFTPLVEMMNWSFKIGPSRIQFWNKDYAVLTNAETGEVFPLYGFVTESSTEPASRPEGHWDGRERQGLPMGVEMHLTLHGGRKVKVTYSGTNLHR